MSRRWRSSKLLRIGSNNSSSNSNSLNSVVEERRHLLSRPSPPNSSNS